jgi:hypothetical protein
VITSASHSGPAGWVLTLIGTVVLAALGLVRVLPPDSLTGRALTSLLQTVGPIRSDEEYVPRLTVVLLLITSAATIVAGIVLIATGH